MFFRTCSLGHNVAVAAIILTATALGLLAACSSSTSLSTPSAAPSPSSGNSICPAVTVTMAQGPLTGVAPMPAPAPVPPPTPGSTNAGSVCVSDPFDGATVSSPAHVQASATLVNPIDHMRVYVDGVPIFFSWFNVVDALLFMDPGSHHLVVVATDKNNNDVSTSFDITVSGTAGTPEAVSNLQNFSGWEPCGQLYPPGHPRAGQICASGAPGTVASMTQNQASPSLSGSSAKFSIAGPTGYEIELWTNYFGGGNNTSHFTYDLYFMLDNGAAAQGLEFDVNQTFGNRRWVYGTECNFKGTGRWDVWDSPSNMWHPTSVPCTAFPSNTWIHLVWQFERIGDQVHYISVSVNDQTFPVDAYYQSQPNWTIEGIDVAFQMDGDSTQTPYTVWLDKVNLITW